MERRRRTCARFCINFFIFCIGWNKVFVQRGLSVIVLLPEWEWDAWLEPNRLSLNQQSRAKQKTSRKVTNKFPPEKKMSSNNKALTDSTCWEDWRLKNAKTENFNNFEIKNKLEIYQICQNGIFSGYTDLQKVDILKSFCCNIDSKSLN